MFDAETFIVRGTNGTLQLTAGTHRMLVSRISVVYGFFLFSPLQEKKSSYECSFTFKGLQYVFTNGVRKREC